MSDFANNFRIPAENGAIVNRLTRVAQVAIDEHWTALRFKRR